MAQSTCGAGPAAPYRQSAIQPVSPNVPLLPTTPQVPTFSAPPSAPSPSQPYVSPPMLPATPSAPMLPGGTTPQQIGGNLGASQLGGSLAGGLMVLDTPSLSTAVGSNTSAGGLPSALNTRATTIVQTMNETFTNGIDPSAWGYNYPWSNTCDTNGNADATQYAAYVSPNCSSQAGAGVFSTGANGLSIAIKPTPGGVDSAGKPYVSGQIYSKQAFKPGTYIETTAKLPTGSGLGGAFWLIPQSGAWPPEIDVMESQGENPNSVTQTIHDKMPDGSVSNQQLVANVSGSQSGFHTYGVDFETDKITFYTDGAATGSFDTPASFQQGMYAILSTNASPPGSQNWHGTVAPGTPATDYQVQSVRAYCLTNCK